MENKKDGFKYLDDDGQYHIAVFNEDGMEDGHQALALIEIAHQLKELNKNLKDLKISTDHISGEF